MVAHDSVGHTQSLGLALYRTYAVPTVGRLLADTGEFQLARALPLHEHQ
jgi:hypothetical protein